MKILVQKYGGTSVGDLNKIAQIAQYIANCIKNNPNRKIIAVVSAMNKTTNELIAKARELTPNPDLRELDQLLQIGEIETAALLAMKLQEHGIIAESLTAAQIGLTTDQRFGNATILGVRRQNILSLLKSQEVLVVTGFQGIALNQNKTMQITTVGRGGSDAVAVALAAELKADCTIFTDVDGVYAVDPRVVPNALKFKVITPVQMIKMYQAGAGVMMGRSVEIGAKYNVPILVQLSPSFGQSDGGTIIKNPSYKKIESSPYAESAGLGIKPIGMIIINNVPNQPGMALKIFQALEKINLEEIMQIPPPIDIPASIGIIVKQQDMEKAIAEIKKIAHGGSILLEGDVNCYNDLFSLTLVDPTMINSTGYLLKMTKALSDQKINIESIFSAQDKLGVVVKENCYKEAAQALAIEFGLTNK